VIIALGFGPEAKILFISISCFFPIILNTIAGVQTVSPSLVKVGRLFGGSKPAIYRKIILPYAINFVLTGMRIAARTGLVVMYATEIFGAPAGLGYWVILQTDVFNMAGGFAGVLVLVITALTALTVFDFLDNLFRPWKSEVAF
jgi:NitT/TauT family transport system permease protein